MSSVFLHPSTITCWCGVEVSWMRSDFRRTTTYYHLGNEVEIKDEVFAEDGELQSVGAWLKVIHEYEETDD